MTSGEVRSRFLDFFAQRGHRIVKSSSLVPANDPTLLFANAGMNQFKDVFLGRERRDYLRATTSQKCVRAGGKHNDLEQVGRTTRHHTFFEMLGNFSFGDYFKKQAIPWAWELMTKDFGLPPAKLYVTTFLGSGSGPEDSGMLVPCDDEAYNIWFDQGVPHDRIFRLGLIENFWQMGDTGPCGPCSEIHYDLGPLASEQGHADCKFPCDCGRYVELWNLVFMQYSRYCRYERDGYPPKWDEKAKAEHKHSDNGYECLALDLLPKPSIDTGAGLERLSAVLQGKLSNFDTDLFRPLIDEAAALANVEYGANHDSDVSLRIIADHARSATFLISDGVLPSNEGRGYVLRRIVRRALYHGQTLGLIEPFLYRMSGNVVQMMKDAYPELLETERLVAKAIKIEEEQYARTIAVGLTKLEERLAEARRKQMEDLIQTQAEEIKQKRVENETHLREVERRDGPSPALEALRRQLNSAVRGLEDKLIEARRNLDRDLTAADRQFVRSLPELDGATAFRLHDTFGLPLDLMMDLARDRGFRLDWAGYEAEMQKQRERARASWKGAEKKTASPAYLALAEKGRTVFDGYAQTASNDCRIVALMHKGDAVNEAGPSAEIEIVLDHTPFYAESGGQVGDVGRLLATGSDLDVAHVTNTYSPVSGVIAHKAMACEAIHIGDLVTAQADSERRDAIRRNHTATHLLHAALRKTLGTHVKQAGSLVAPDRLRFDFSHYAGLGDQDLLDIEDLVNQHVLANEEMQTQMMDIDAAVATGAMALFGEKYGDRVRVVSVGDGSYSRELCGGTHVRRTGDIGLFKITSESSVAAGTRRIEALTGTGVLEHLRRESKTLQGASGALRVKPGELIDAIEKITESEKKLRKELEAQQMKRAASAAGDLAQQARDVKGVRVVAARVEVTDRAALRQMVDDLRGKLQSGVIVLGSVSDGRVSLIAAVTKDLTPKLDAGKIVKQVATYVEGSGGGRKDLAEAGGKNPAKLDESLQAVPAIIEQML